jgi:ribosomal protein S18 acetylase RimI-like enzyme
VKPELRLDTGPSALLLLDDILPTYADVYAEPPYSEGPDDVADFAASWERRVSSPGFRLVRALLDDSVVGFTFGHRLAPTTAWWDGAVTPLPPDVTSERPGRTFAIIELAVRAWCRRQGIGRLMHDLLLDDAGAERVTLLVRPEPEARPARAAYESWGYRQVGKVRPGSDLPTYNALLRAL